MAYIMKVDQDTWLKQSTAQSQNLPDNLKQWIASGTRLPLLNYEPLGNHVKVTLGTNPQGEQLTYQARNTWYVFRPAVEILQNDKVLPLLPDAVNLPIPHYQYENQNDNRFHPEGTCNVTSIAMNLAYLGVPQHQSHLRFADELEQYCEQKGLDRHAPADLMKVVEAYGCKDEFTYNGEWDKIKAWIGSGLPVVVHTKLTQSGHVILLRGYDKTGVWVNDPNGEWFPNGYDETRTGENLHYSWDLMYDKVSADNQLWAHHIIR